MAGQKAALPSAPEPRPGRGLSRRDACATLYAICIVSVKRVFRKPGCRSSDSSRKASCFVHGQFSDAKPDPICCGRSPAGSDVSVGVSNHAIVRDSTALSVSFFLTAALPAPSRTVTKPLYAATGRA